METLQSRKCLLADVDGTRRKCRQNWIRDRSVSIPPYLRPIEEESDDEDHLNSLSVDRCNDSTSCRAMTSAAGARDVTPRLLSERLRNDVIANGQQAFDTDDESRNKVTESSSSDCRQPISERVADDVITTGECTPDDGMGGNCITDNDVIGQSPSPDARRPISEGESCRTGENDVTGESPESKQHWRLFYVIVASLTAFVACLTTMSLSGFIFIVTVMSLIAHHVIQS